ncbi:hypothetical protein CBER1_11422 [Cercospora berteroae]|uniref:Uncharacterized protein n=1 Tax=Cercospora berteroae TaxID=357750 RepID=A0A2S6BYU0_9PEZI|nr:hypothetical protein CBER1_11422 [Cercospora berteroae]
MPTSSSSSSLRTMKDGDQLIIISSNDEDGDQLIIIAPNDAFAMSGWQKVNVGGTEDDNTFVIFASDLETKLADKIGRGLEFMSTNAVLVCVPRAARTTSLASSSTLPT